MDRDPATVRLDELDRLWDFGDPAGSERRFSELLERARIEQGGALLAEVLTQVARARGLQRHFDAADATLDDAEAVLRPDDARGLVRLRLERGRVANTAGREGRGRNDFRAAWDLARATGEDALAVDAAHMLGIVERGNAGWEWNERAMELACRSDDPGARRWIGSLTNNMGWARHDEGDENAAIALFERSRDAFLSHGRRDRARVARWSIARCLRARGDAAEALLEHEALLAELDVLGETDGYVLEEIAECLLALDRPDAARPFFARAHAALSETFLADDEPERLQRLRSLGSA